MQQLDDSTYEVQLTDDTYTSNSLERFMTRLLRRDLFTALAEQPHDPAERYNILAFGSAVPQRYRPKEGYEGRRLARDLDLAIRLKNGDGSRPTPAEEEQIGHYILDAVRKINAEIVEQPDKKPAGYHSLHIAKTYTPEEIRQALKGKREENEVVVPDKPLKVPLEISPIFERPGMLPLVPFGDKGFCHEDLREVFAGKMRRLTSPFQEGSVVKAPSGQPVFKVKDLLDLYNILHSYPEQFKSNAKLIRALSLARISESPDSIKNFSSVKPTPENIAAYAKALGIDDLPLMKHMCETVYEGMKEIFPSHRTNLPPAFAGDLSLTLDEYNFMMALEGLEKLPGPGNNVRRIDPAIKPSLILDAEIRAEFPSLAQNIMQIHALKNIVKKTQTQLAADF